MNKKITDMFLRNKNVIIPEVDICEELPKLSCLLFRRELELSYILEKRLYNNICYRIIYDIKYDVYTIYSLLL